MPRAGTWNRSRYGITRQQYALLLIKQKHACPICNAANPNNLDHCHETKKIRGVLCSRCNRLLGCARDNPIILYAAIDYLLQSETHKLSKNTETDQARNPEGPSSSSRKRELALF